VAAYDLAAVTGGGCHARESAPQTGFGVAALRGLFVFAVKDIEEARQLTATDPIIINGEMVAEYHGYYGSAALMLVRETHERLAKKRS
jgi:hypothetical protein